jgi:hypothetical protein
VEENGGHAPGHVRFLWSTHGYELVERAGDPPVPGSELEEDDRRFRVMKVAPSPLPGDRRPCAYLQPI